MELLVLITVLLSVARSGSLQVNMRFSLLLTAAAAQAAVIARDDGCDAPGPDADGRYTISAPGIKAQVCGIE